MKTYELTYIITSDITSEEAEAKAKEIESLIQSEEGIITRQSAPVARTLSYQINGRASGFFGIIEFQMEPEHLIEIKKTLAKDGKIARNMLIIKNAPKIKKERRSKKGPATIIEKIFGRDKKEEEKVELKDIEQQLDEILGE